MGDRDDVRPVNELALERMAPSELGRHALRHQAPGALLVLLAPRRRTDLVDDVGELREGLSGLADGLREALPGSAHDVPARRGLDHPVDAVISWFWIAGSILPSSDSTASQRSTAPGDVARDPEGPHDLRGPRARLGDHPRDERDALGIHDVVRGDRGDELAAQRVVREQVSEPLHHLRGEYRSRSCTRYGESGMSESRSASAMERFA